MHATNTRTKSVAPVYQVCSFTTRELADLSIILIDYLTLLQPLELEVAHAPNALTCIRKWKRLATALLRKVNIG